MKSISIKFLFGGALAIIAVLVVLLGGAVHRLEKASEAVTHANEARYSSYLLADELRQSSDDLTRLVRTYTVTGDPKWAAQYQEVLDIRNGVQPRPNGYEKIYWDFRAADMAASKGTGPAVALADLMKRAGFSAAELGKLDDAAALSNALVKTEVVAMDLVKRHLEASANGTAQEGDTDLASARAMVHDAQYHANKAKIMQPVDEFLVLLDQRTQGAIANAQARKMRWFYVTAVLSFCLLGTLVLVFWYVYQQVNASLRRAIRSADTMASGDLSQPVPIRGLREVATMLQAMQTMQDGLVQVVRKVRQGSEALSLASTEIAQGNNNLSERTEQQASALEETAASMEQLSSTVQHNADSAREANQLVIEASNIAAQGGSVVSQVVQTMKGINQASHQISNIISVIDGIAFQTNILALNAAVEAARWRTRARFCRRRQ